MIRKYLSALACALSVMAANAVNVADMFVSAPDSLMPYVSKEQRSELIGMKRIDQSSSAEINVSLKTSVVVDSLSDDFIRVGIGQVKYEIARLVSSNSSADSVFCVLRTFKTPEPETVGYLYDNSWNMLREIDFDDVFLQTPVVSDAEKEILDKMEFPMVEAHFNSSTSSIVRTISTPLMWKEEKNNSLPILQRNLKWDGESFKEY